MKITVPINHNFYEETPILESGLVDAFNIRKTCTRKVQDLFSSVYELKLGADQLKQIRIFSFKKKRFFEPDAERLIIKLYAKEIENQEKKYFIQTGLYAGTLYHKGCKINITTKYGDVFLKRMLNFVNDIYIDNQQSKSKKDESVNEFLYIIAYLFIQTLEKSAILGIPQEYIKQIECGQKIKGSVDFNTYLKRDIPFQGKLTYSFREQRYIQEIVDVLYLSLRKLETLFGKDIHNRLLGLYQVLRQNYSGKFATYETILRAKTHHVLNNPMYNGFKKVLEYAEIILLDKDLMPDNDLNKLETTGYLFDIAELFELYLEKLLSRNFNNWVVDGQHQLEVYEGKFYARKMFPDIVMKHKETNKVVVFDAKFKSMNMSYNDLDRNDLYQIHSYIGYYNSDAIAGGLIYPFSIEQKTNKSFSDTLYGNVNNSTKFIIDGIHVNENFTIAKLMEKEDEFIKRLSHLLNV